MSFISSNINTIPLTFYLKNVADYSIRCSLKKLEVLLYNWACFIEFDEGEFAEICRAHSTRYAALRGGLVRVSAICEELVA